MKRPCLAAVLCLALALPLWAQEVDVYCSLDQEFSEQILRDFEAETGIKVNASYDVEANKTIGMVNRIIAEQEAGNPRCDVYWNNELAQTIRLKRLGFLQPYASPNAETIPAGFKDAEGYWTGFAARARVIIYNTEALSAEEAPKTLRALNDPKWGGKLSMAKPLTGTTLTHAAALFSVWGESEAKNFYRDLLRRDIRWEAGNAMVMRSVGQGNYAWGYTDTDDANVSRIKGHQTAIIVPDQGEGEMGTLLIPNSVAVVKGARNLDPARRLVDYLLSPAVEAKLAQGRSAQIPLHPGVETPEGVLRLDDIKAMAVDWEKVAAMIEEHDEWLHESFEPKEAEGKKFIYFAIGAFALLVIFLLMRGLKKS
jgi:iron(III) transport system substrate-binding protein